MHGFLCMSVFITPFMWKHSLDEFNPDLSISGSSLDPHSRSGLTHECKHIDPDSI